MSDKIEKLRAEVDKYLPEATDISQKVLIIDDEFRNLRSFKSQFGNKAKIFTALNLEQALCFLKSEEIDIVFCDYLMPENNGVEVLSVIAEKYPHIKRVVLTAYNTPRARKEFKEKAKTTEFILKPYSYDEVFNTIYNIA